jgi:GNAT superfamily N-acetyltransferase
VKTRVATAADIDRLAALINRSYDVAESFFVDGARITTAELGERMAAGQFLVTDGMDGGPNACIYVRVTGDRAYLGLLAVDLSLQRRGHGGLLLDAAEEYCRAQGCVAIDIEVVNLRAELFPRYEARGYRPTGTRPFDDPRLTQPAHFVRMSKALPRV